MNDFLRKQLQKKVDKFLEGKDDAFVVSVTEGMIYGGVMNGKPKGLSDAEFETFKNEIIGEATFVNWLSDMRNPDKMFFALSLSEKDYLAQLSHMLHYECFYRLRKGADSAKPEKKVNVVAEKKEKISKVAQVFNFNKGIHGLDNVYDVLRTLNAVTRKPQTEADKKKYDLHESDLGDMSDYEIFDKPVTITVEIGK